MRNKEDVYYPVYKYTEYHVGQKIDYFQKFVNSHSCYMMTQKVDLYFIHRNVQYIIWSNVVVLNFMIVMYSLH